MSTVRCLLLKTNKWIWTLFWKSLIYLTCLFEALQVCFNWWTVGRVNTFAGFASCDTYSFVQNKSVVVLNSFVNGNRSTNFVLMLCMCVYIYEIRNSWNTCTQLVYLWYRLLWCTCLHVWTYLQLCSWCTHIICFSNNNATFRNTQFNLNGFVCDAVHQMGDLADLGFLRYEILFKKDFTCQVLFLMYIYYIYKLLL